MFATPLFLIAAAAGACVPLALHMLQTSKTEETPFPTLRFLKMAEQKASRRIRMEHWLLWVLRTILMVCLGFAFAMPMIRTNRLAWLGDRPRDVAIIIDASYSMDYSMGRKTVWDRAIEEATAIIKGLGPNDRYCLYLARDFPEPIIAEPIGGIDQGVSQLKGLQLKHSSSQLAGALAAANDALNKQEGRREREIYILTDTQALPWNSFGRLTTDTEGEDTGTRTLTAGTDTWDASSLDKNTTLFVALLGATAPENVSPIEATVIPPLLFAGMPAKVTARLSLSGSAQDSAITLFVDDKEISRRSVVAGAASSEDLTFAIPPLEPGVHTGRIETPADNLAADNTFHFLMRAKKDLPTLCVGAKDDTFFIRAALNATFQEVKGFDSKWIEPHEVANEQLANYACIFSCNALPMPGQSSSAIEQYVKSGGLLVMLPGSDASMGDYTAWDSLPGFPARVKEIPSNDRLRMLAWSDPHHRLLRPLQDGEVAPVITIRRALLWEHLHDKAKTLATCGAGQPFLIEREYGRGRVLMFAVPADRSWSEFPLSPFYLPLIHQSVEYGGGIGASAPFLWSTELLPLEEYLPEATRETSLFDADNRKVPIRSSVENGRTVLHAEDMTIPGIYTMKIPGQPGQQPALAINVPRAESTLTPVVAEDIPKILGTDVVHIATDGTQLRQLIEDHRIGRTFGEQLLWLVLILAAFEFFYASSLLKKQPTLSDQMALEASGKVSVTGLHAGLMGEGKDKA